jgi:DNA-binding MarR family transcriptional regulator
MLASVAPSASSLQREIKQRRPFASTEQAGVLGLLRTADLVRRCLSGIVEPHGITLQQYNVLRILRGAGDAGLPTLEIVTRMVERAPGITRLLDRLERKKLVRRRRCPEDHRQVLCWVTQEGLDLLARLDRPMEKADATALGGLPRREVTRLISLLDAVRAGNKLPHRTRSREGELKP